MTQSAGAGIRRIVTGHDAAGKAVVIADGVTPVVHVTPGRPGFSWKAGDVAVQRGTNHAWSNRSQSNARVTFVLIDAEPLA
jgi:hypothetical protein